MEAVFFDAILVRSVSGSASDHERHPLFSFSACLAARCLTRRGANVAFAMM